MPMFSITPFLALNFLNGAGPCVEAPTFDVESDTAEGACHVAYGILNSYPGEMFCRPRYRDVVEAYRQLRHRSLSVGDFLRINPAPLSEADADEAAKGWPKPIGLLPSFFQVANVGFTPIRKWFPDFDPSTAFSILVDVSPTFAASTDDGDETTRRFLAAWYNDPSLNMYEFGLRWVEANLGATSCP